MSGEKIVDVLIFGGQSNMQGQTEGTPNPNEVVENSFEYRYLTDSLVPLKHPVGEVVDSLLYAPVEGSGTILPDCCRTYVNATGHDVVAIHAARGGTKISEWLRGTDQYDAAKKKILGGIGKAKTVGKIGKIYYLWLQGESDALALTKENEYYDMLIDYKNQLKEDICIDIFGIIEVGYFCYITGWVPGLTDDGLRKVDEEIMRAQERAVDEDSDFAMLTQICKFIEADPTYFNPNAVGHYNNKAMTAIGIAAGEALAKL